MYHRLSRHITKDSAANICELCWPDDTYTARLEASPIILPYEFANLKNNTPWDAFIQNLVKMIPCVGLGCPRNTVILVDASCRLTYESTPARRSANLTKMSTCIRYYCGFDLDVTGAGVVVHWSGSNNSFFGIKLKLMNTERFQSHTIHQTKMTSNATVHFDPPPPAPTPSHHLPPTT